MEYLITIVAGIALLVAILACLAIYGGWFRLKAQPTNEKVEFILMRKQDKSQEDHRNSPMKPEQKIVTPGPPANNAD